VHLFVTISGSIMQRFLPLLAALVLSLTCAFAQQDQRPGVQAPNFWLISPTQESPGAVGFECAEGIDVQYTIVFPGSVPKPGQSLVVTHLDPRTRRCYTQWGSAVSTQSTAASDVVRVDVKTPTPIAQNSTAIVVVDVPQARIGDVVSASPLQDLPDGLVVASARVMEGGKVQIRLVNTLAGAVDPSTMLFSLALIHVPNSQQAAD